MISLDNIINRVSLDYVINAVIIRNKPLTSNNKPLIKNRTLHLPSDSSKLIIIIPPVAEKSIQTNILKNKIINTKHAYAEYEINPHLMSANYKNTLAEFQYIRDKICGDLDKLHAEYKFSQYTIIGLSAGCITALNVAKHRDLINNVTLVGPGSSIVDTLWESIRTKQARTNLEKRISKEELKSAWQEIEPCTGIDKLKNKNIEVYLSQTDKVVPYQLGIKLVEEMERNEINLTIKDYPWLGHYGLLTYFLLLEKNIKSLEK